MSWLLMLWLRGLLLLMLLHLRFALLLTLPLLLVLCVGGDNGSEKQKQGPCADS
jgi:hypothetical protein